MEANSRDLSYWGKNNLADKIQI